MTKEPGLRATTEVNPLQFGMPVGRVHNGHEVMTVATSEPEGYEDCVSDR